MTGLPSRAAFAVLTEVPRLFPAAFAVLTEVPR